MHDRRVTHDDSKPCAHVSCRKPLYRAAGETVSAWRRRRFCSVKCAVEAKKDDGQPRRLDYGFRRNRNKRALKRWLTARFENITDAEIAMLHAIGPRVILHLIPTYDCLTQPTGGAQNLAAD